MHSYLEAWLRCSQPPYKDGSLSIATLPVKHKITQAQEVFFIS